MLSYRKQHLNWYFADHNETHEMFSSPVSAMLVSRAQGKYHEIAFVKFTTGQTTIVSCEVSYLSAGLLIRYYLSDKKSPSETCISFVDYDLPD